MNASERLQQISRLSKEAGETLSRLNGFKSSREQEIREHERKLAALDEQINAVQAEYDKKLAEMNVAVGDVNQPDTLAA